MCLIQVSNNIKLIVGCAVSLYNNLQLFTNNFRVKKARQYILEFLLSNHPLDCPICDQGGECDLQDLSFIFGNDRGRFFYDVKRAVEDKVFDYFIKTIMTRCIHCTRCVRFLVEVSDFFFLGVTGRGYSMEIGTYYDTLSFDELSGNIIDLCPVGALTSKAYAFKARSWELLSINSIDILDCLGSNIRIDYYGNKIMRILPRLNEWINEEWISNKIRFCYDSISIQRLFFPLLKIFFFENSSKFIFKFIRINWLYSFYYFIFQLINIYLINWKIFNGFFIDYETFIFYKFFYNFLGNNDVDYSFYNFIFKLDFKSNFLFNINLLKLENIMFLFFINTNLRLDLPLLNIRFRKQKKNLNSLNFFSFGLGVNYLNFYIKNISNSFYKFCQLFEGKLILCKLIIKFTIIYFIINFFIFLNMEIDFFFWIRNYFIYYLFFQLSFNFLHYDSSKCTNLNSFFNIFHKNKRNFYIKKNKIFATVELYLGSNFIKNNISNSIYDFFKNKIIVQSSFGNTNFNKANLILPSSLFVEDNFLYFNVEGICQFLNKVIKAPGISKSNLSIGKAFYSFFLFNYYSIYFYFKNFIKIIFIFSFLLQLNLKFFLPFEKKKFKFLFKFFFQRSRFYSFILFIYFIYLFIYIIQNSIFFSNNIFSSFIKNNPILNYSKIIRTNFNKLKGYNYSFFLYS